MFHKQVLNQAQKSIQTALKIAPNHQQYVFFFFFTTSTGSVSVCSKGINHPAGNIIKRWDVFHTSPHSQPGESFRSAAAHLGL